MAQPIPRQHTPAESRATPPRRKRGVVRTLLALVIVPILLGLVVVLVLANTPWGNERVRRVLVSQANERMYGHLDVRELRGNLFSGATLKDVRLSDSARKPLFTARRVQVRYALLACAAWPDRDSLARARHGGGAAGQAARRALELPDADEAERALEGHDATPPTARAVGDHHAPRAHALPAPVAPGHDTDGGSARLGDRPRARGDVARARGARAGRIPARGRLPRHRRTAADGAACRTTASRSPWRSRRSRCSASRIGRRRWTCGRSSGRSMHRRTRSGGAARECRCRARASSATGRSGSGGMGFFLDLVASPLSFPDLKWLNPQAPPSGGGRVHYAMRIHGDSTSISLADADLHYRDASVVGRAAITRVHPKGGRVACSSTVRISPLARLSTAIVHELEPTLKLRRSGTLNGHVVVSGPTRDLRLDADVTFDDATAGRSHVVARGGMGMERTPTARDLAVQLRPLQLATVSGAGLRLPVGGVLEGDATVSGGMSAGWRVRGDVVHVDRGARSHVIGGGSYATGTHRSRPTCASRRSRSRRWGGSSPPRGCAASSPATCAPRARRGTCASPARCSRHREAARIDANGSVALRGARTRYDFVAVRRPRSTRAHSRARAEQQSHRHDRGARRRHHAGDGERRRARRSHEFAMGHAARRSAADAARRGGRSRAAGYAVAARTRRQRARRRARSGWTLTMTARCGSRAAVDSLGVLRPWIGTSDTSVVSAPAAEQRARLAAARRDSVRRADAVRIERLALGLPEGVTLALDTVPPLRRDSLAGSLRVSGTLIGNVKRARRGRARVTGTDLVARGSSARALHATFATADLRGGADVPLRFTLDADTVHVAGRAFERVESVRRGHIAWTSRLRRAATCGRTRSSRSPCAARMRSRRAACASCSSTRCAPPSTRSCGDS